MFLVLILLFLLLLFEVVAVINIDVASFVLNLYVTVVAVVRVVVVVVGFIYCRDQNLKEIYVLKVTQRNVMIKSMLLPQFHTHPI